jgi:hypothetical protein
MKNMIVVLLLSFAATAQVTLTINLTANKASRLSSAVCGFRPIPQINTGTEENPVWVDSCTALQWSRFVVIDELSKKVRRWEEMEAKKAVTTEDW